MSRSPVSGAGADQPVAPLLLSRLLACAPYTHDDDVSAPASAGGGQKGPARACRLVVVSDRELT